MAETSKHDPGWWQHILGAIGMSAAISAMHYFDVSQTWILSVLLIVFWPIREFDQNGLGFLGGRSFWEWLPASVIISACETAWQVHQ